MKSRGKIIISVITVLVLLGGFLRFYDLGKQSLWIDEGYTVEAAMQILNQGEPRFANDKIYKNHFLQSYLVAGSIAVFGFDPYNPWPARLPSVIFGILLIPASYFLIFLIFRNHGLALISAGLVAFSVLEIGWSRQARGYTSEQFFILLSLIFLWLYIKKDKILFGLLSATSFTLSTAFHLLSTVFLPGIVIIFLLTKVSKKQSFGIREILFLIFFIPITIYILSLGIPHFVAIEHYFDYFIKEIPILILLAALGLFFGFKDKERAEGITFMAINMILPITAFMFTAPIAHNRYLVIVLPFIFFFATYAIFRIFELFFKNKPLQKVILIVMTLFILLFPNIELRPPTDYDLGFDTPLTNFSGAYDFVKDKVKEDSVLISAHPHMSKLYLGKIGRWIPFSISGDPREKDWVIFDGNKERVTGALIIEDFTELGEILDTQHGFIIVDRLFERRIKNVAVFINDHKNTNLIFESLSPHSDIWVLEF